MLMIPKPKNIHKLVDKLVIKELPTISGELNYEYSNKIIQALYDNTSILTKTLAGVKHSHVNLIMEDTIYAKLKTGTPWEELDDPGASSTIFTNTTAAHRQQTNDSYGKSRQILKIPQPRTKPSCIKYFKLLNTLTLKNSIANIQVS